MKRIILLAILSISLISFSQKAKKEKLSYRYERNPLIKIDPATTNYKTKLIVKYEDAQKKRLQQYNKEVQNAQDEHKMAMEHWDGEGYQPTMRHVSKPRLRYIPKRDVFNDLLKLDGFERGDKNPFIATVTLTDVGYSVTDKQEQKPDKSGKMVTQYWKEVAYHMNFKYNITDPSGKIILEKKLALNAEQKKVTPRYNKYSDLRNHFANNSTYKKKNLFANYFASQINSINYKWNYTYGYSEASKSNYFYKAKGKKHNYSDVDAAFRLLQSGLESLTSNKESAIKSLNEAIVSFDKLLKAEEPENKKAKISSSVGNGLRVNKIYCLILLGKYSQADKLLTGLESDKSAKKFKQDAKGLREFLTEEIKRNPKS